MDKPIQTAAEDFTPLTREEIDSFFEDLDADDNGYVTFEELEAKLEEVHKELAPEPQKHHLLHPARRDLEKNVSHRGDGLHAFLCQLLPECDSKISKADFTRRMEALRVPSQKQTDSKEQDDEDNSTEKKLPMRRRLRAYWAVHGPTILFMTFVVTLMIAFGVWQMVVYIQNPLARRALGWGIIVAKLAAGVLYPTLFFMLLSMSRHFSTFLRKSYIISRFVNWDLSQAFHIRMSVTGLFFATLHGIGHLAGSAVFSSSPSRQSAVAEYLGVPTPRSYADYIRVLPGWSGVTALGLFWNISLLSMPFIRKRSYEIFQLGHLLMFPMIGLLCAHGTAALLQAPMLGYWLAFPALLVIFERAWRLCRGFMGIPAQIKVLDDDAVLVTCKHPKSRDWRYSAGQYILLQVPQISLFQWHPFTISSCRGNILQVHIKVEGDWTQKLRDLDQIGDIRVGIDGPFGAPAQRFYDYDYSIIIGGGIGITPFSAILTDLEEHYTGRKDPWEERRRSRSQSRPGSRSASRRRQSYPGSPNLAQSDSDTIISNADLVKKPANPERRVDFHWTVREKNNLLWFSDLLNRAIEGAKPLARHGNLDLNINTHITAKRKKISTHIFRYLLDSYRTEAAPYSALTGLKQPSHFGRPDFDDILERHFQDLLDAGITEKKVGVVVNVVKHSGEFMKLTDICSIAERLWWARYFPIAATY